MSMAQGTQTSYPALPSTTSVLVYLTLLSQPQGCLHDLIREAHWLAALTLLACSVQRARRRGQHRVVTKLFKGSPGHGTLLRHKIGVTSPSPAAAAL